jgi:hypothetical protein
LTDVELEAFTDALDDLEAFTDALDDLGVRVSDKN